MTAPWMTKAEWKAIQKRLRPKLNSTRAQMLGYVEIDVDDLLDMIEHINYQEERGNPRL